MWVPPVGETQWLTRGPPSRGPVDQSMVNIDLVNADVSRAADPTLWMTSDVIMPHGKPRGCHGSLTECFYFLKIIY